MDVLQMRNRRTVIVYLRQIDLLSVWKVEGTRTSFVTTLTGGQFFCIFQKEALVRK